MNSYNKVALMKKALIYLPPWAIFSILMLPFVSAAVIPFGVFISMATFVFWLLCVGNALKAKAIRYSNVYIKYFNASLLYVTTYTFLVEIVFKKYLPKSALPFHLLAVFCLFGSLFYASKLLVICEDKKTVKANRCFGTFLLFWFFPIGIWVIHPRIKKILSVENGENK